MPTTNKSQEAREAVISEYPGAYCWELYDKDGTWKAVTGHPAYKNRLTATGKTEEEAWLNLFRSIMEQEKESLIRESFTANSEHKNNA